MTDGTVQRRGSKPLSERDWIFGSRPRRRLLEGVLLGAAPADGWTRPELAALARVVANGGVDEHVNGLVRLGLLAAGSEQPATWLRVEADSELAAGVRKTLEALASRSEQAPEQTLAPAPVDTEAVGRRIRAAERAVETAWDLEDAERAEVLRLLHQARARLGAGG